MNSQSRLFSNIITLAATLGIIALSGCASSPVPTLEQVGPKPPNAARMEPIQGYLKVYSDTNSFNDGDVMYYPHSEYWIYNNDGKKFKFVPNHISNNDETPEVVPVPVGTYYILAKSEVDGIVRVPVMIKGGRTTVVNLEKNTRTSNTDTQGVESARGVKSPSGHVAGWRANS